MIAFTFGAMLFDEYGNCIEKTVYAYTPNKQLAQKILDLLKEDAAISGELSRAPGVIGGPKDLVFSKSKELSNKSPVEDPNLASIIDAIDWDLKNESV